MRQQRAVDEVLKVGLPAACTRRASHFALPQAEGAAVRAMSACEVHALEPWLAGVVGTGSGLAF